MMAFFRNLFYFIVFVGVLVLIAAVMYAKELEQKYRLNEGNLDGALWSMPARVYARPMELYAGAPVSLNDLENELQLLGFSEVEYPIKGGQYQKTKKSITYYADAFSFWDATVPPRKIQVEFADGKVDNVENLTLNENVILERLNPLHIASIFPSNKQDRSLVKLQEVPPILIDGLLALEDKRFWVHQGIDPKGLARSIYITFVARSGRQGASTITQQFIKNHYLTNEQTISRKVKEILMAIVLEKHRSKEQILEAYLNEIYLGQDGKRAIHGFGLASEYYFNKKLNELNLHEVALLLGLVREPGSADPRNHPEYALQRRNFILKQLQEHGLIDEKTTELAQALPLDVVSKEETSDRVKFPAFVDLVFQQLYENYSSEDLTKEGLNIFSTLDPQIQQKSQKALTATLEKIEKGNGLKKNFLQSAAVIVDVISGEVNAIVGSRVAGEQGFNRAIQAKRQIGSVVKPAVYLAALEYPQIYSLASVLQDSPLNHKQGGTTWNPKNYNQKYKGRVNFADSLIHSYNVPTARIALQLGVEDIISTLKRLGAWSNIPPYPSISLGTIEMSPLEVAQIYETFANSGYFTPLRSIRAITTKEGVAVKHFEVKNIQAIMPAPHYLIVSTMQEIPKRGTATSMKSSISPELNVAGKTGTTDNYRDSWFAGFTGNYLAVAWVGNDGNKPTRLSGTKGGLPVWINVMKELPLKPLELTPPDSVSFVDIDINSGYRAGAYCHARRIPFVAGFEPTNYKNCAAPVDVDDGGFDETYPQSIDLSQPQVQPITL